MTFAIATRGLKKVYKASLDVEVDAG